MVIMPRLARTSGPERRMPRRTSGAGERRSIATKSDSRAALSAKAPIVCGRAPALVGRLDDGADEQEHPGGERQAPGKSKRRRDERGAAVVRDHARRRSASSASAIGTGSRKVQRQPSSVSSAAEDEAEREAAGARRGVDAEGAVALGALGERRRDDRQARRRGEGRGGALQEARDDEQRAVVDEPAEGRGDGEDAQRDEQRPAAAEQVGGAPAEQQQAAVAEHVAGDDPLQLRGREVQVGVDRGQRDADHRDVEPVEEEHAAEDDEQEVWRGRMRESIRREYMQPHKFYVHIDVNAKIAGRLL